MLGHRVLPFSQLVLPQPLGRQGSLKCCSSSNGNGNGLNGSAHTLGNQQTVEMHIANTDTFDDYGHLNENGMKRRNSVHVTPPRDGPPQQIETHIGPIVPVSDPADRAEIKAVKAELSMVNAELRSKNSELADSERHLRAREGEVKLLRAALTGRDISLRNAKNEAAEAQALVQDKDTELQSAFKQLLSNSQERAGLRQTLLAVQDELSDTRLELENWTQKGFDLNSHDGAPNGSSRNGVDRNQITKLLENLNKLSQTIADDAYADEQELKNTA